MKRVVIRIAVLLALLVAAAGGLFWISTGQIEAASREILANSPVIQEHLGSLQKVDWDWKASRELDRENTFVFDVVGAEGAGQVVLEIRTVDDSAEITGGELRLADGTIHPLIASEEPSLGG